MNIRYELRTIEIAILRLKKLPAFTLHAAHLAPQSVYIAAVRNCEHVKNL